MKCIISLVTTGVAVGLTAFAPGVLAQSSNGPSATSVAPTESPAAAAHESSSAPTSGPDARSVPDARSSLSIAGPAADSNTRLAAVTPRGMSTEDACTGFRSIRECAAAMHAAQNLSVPFGDLKSKLTRGQKLGAAIHGLRPEANAPEEESRAESQARSDVGLPQG